SYFTGSDGSNFLRSASNSDKALPSFCLRRIRPSLRATLPESTSRGHDSCEGEILSQIPKSTPLPSFLTIHRKNILIRLAAEPFCGSETCFVVLERWSSSKNIFLKLEMDM